MPNILRRDVAPITDQAWSELDEVATDVLKRVLTGRKVVDFSGPHGWEFPGVNLGRLKATKTKAGGIGWGVREFLPAVEIRAQFSLSQWELDNITRGAADADVDALEQTAAAAAKFEDDAIFNGFSQGNIEGICKAASQKAVTLPKDVEKFPQAVADAVKAMSLSGIGGPYALVLSPDAYYTLAQSAGHGYPPRKAIDDILAGGDVLMTDVLDGGVVLSTRGGDFELAVGQDLSLGYESHDKSNVELFLTESFTFRVLEPRAAVLLKKAGR